MECIFSISPQLDIQNHCNSAHTQNYHSWYNLTWNFRTHTRKKYFVKIFLNKIKRSTLEKTEKGKEVTRIESFLQKNVFPLKHRNKKTKNIQIIYMSGEKIITQLFLHSNVKVAHKTNNCIGNQNSLKIRFMTINSFNQMFTA
jgi:hypothetical protein